MIRVVRAVLRFAQDVLLLPRIWSNLVRDARASDEWERKLASFEPMRRRIEAYYKNMEAARD